jgi:hypothetical protein
MTNQEEAKNCLDAYDRVMKSYEMNNDHYFKRTQILMIVIQSALFVALAKLASGAHSRYAAATDKVHLVWGAASIMVLSILGVLGALFWFLMIIRQHKRMEFGRTCLRHLEHRMSCVVPLQYFQKEQDAFWYREPVNLLGTNEFSLKFMRDMGSRGSVIEVEKMISAVMLFFWLISCATCLVILYESCERHVFMQIVSPVALFSMSVIVLFVVVAVSSCLRRKCSKMKTPDAVK